MAAGLSLKTPFGISCQELDRRFPGLLSSQLDDAVTQAHEAAANVVKLTAEAVSDKARAALKQFHQLYSSQAMATRNINDDVDALFEAAQRGRAHEVDIGAETLAIAAIQKELEALVQMDEKLRGHLEPLMASLQFAEDMKLKCHHVAQIITTFLKLAPKQLDNPWACREAVRPYSVTPSEKLLFAKLIDHSRAIASPEAFEEGLLSYLEHCLIWCNTASEKAVLDVSRIFEAVLADGKRIAKVSQKSLDALRKIGSNHGSVQELKTILIDLSSDKSSLDDTAALMMQALQFQDRLRQMIENSCKWLRLWYRHRHCSTEINAKDLGDRLLEATAMFQERKRIAQTFPEVGEIKEEATEGSSFFF